MGVFNNWPYTNIHEMNLDWILEEIKKLIDSNAALGKSFEELKTYVEDYFKNLDVSDEVRAKLDEMVADGSLEAIIDDYIEPFLASIEGRIGAIEDNYTKIKQFLNIEFIDDITKVIPTLEDGSVNNPSNPDCVHTNKIPVKYGQNAGVMIHRKPTDGYYYVFGSALYDGNGNLITNTTQDYSVNQTNPTKVNKQTNGYYVAFSITESNGTRYNQLRISDFAEGDVEVLVEDGENAIDTYHSYSIKPNPEVGSSHYVDSEDPVIKVMTYNVAQYKCDSSFYIDPEHVRNTVNMITREWPDFLGTQEDTRYMNAAGTIEASSYIWQNAFQEWYAGGLYNENRIYSHFNHVEGGLLDYRNVHSWSRTIKYDTYTMPNGKKLLFCTTHCAIAIAGYDSHSNEAIQERYVEYNDIMRWCNGNITLNDKTTAQAVTAPTHDYAIVVMDANCVTEQDRTNLITLGDTNNFKLCNGGKFGWFNTCYDPLGAWPIDNILVSGDVVIKSAKTLIDEYGELYSDHTPFVAEIILR